MADPMQVQMFMDVTGTTSEVAEQILQAANYDLELAVHLHMEGTPPQSVQNESDSHVSASVAGGSSSLDYQDLTGDDEENIRAPIAPRMDCLISSEEDNFTTTLGRKRHATRSVFVPLRDFSEEARIHEEELMAVASGSDGGGGSALNCRNKRKKLEDLFRPPIDICYIGSFQNARDAATSHNMWLLVNLQDHTEFACQVLNRDIWSNKDVKEVIRNNFVFWQVSVDSTDGARFKTFYSVYNCPYVCVIDPRTGENKHHWQNVESNFKQELERFLLLTPNPLISPKYKAPIETVVNLSEEDQLALAIKNSLQENPDNEEDSNTSNDPSDSNESNNDFQLKESYENYLGDESDDKTKISVRLPDGTREMLEWPCSTKIKALKLYIEHKYSSITKDPYKILTTFPRQDISTETHETKSLVEANLHPTSIVHVHLEDE